MASLLRQMLMTGCSKLVSVTYRPPASRLLLMPAVMVLRDAVRNNASPACPARQAGHAFFFTASLNNTITAGISNNLDTGRTGWRRVVFHSITQHQHCRHQQQPGRLQDRLAGLSVAFQVTDSRQSSLSSSATCCGGAALSGREACRSMNFSPCKMQAHWHTCSSNSSGPRPF